MQNILIAFFTRSCILKNINFPLHIRMLIIEQSWRSVLPYLWKIWKKISKYSPVKIWHPPPHCGPTLPLGSKMAFIKVTAFPAYWFLGKRFWKIFLYSFRCKNSTPIVAPPYMYLWGGHDLNKWEALFEQTWIYITWGCNNTS